MPMPVIVLLAFLSLALFSFAAIVLVDTVAQAVRRVNARRGLRERVAHLEKIDEPESV